MRGTLVLILSLCVGATAACALGGSKADEGASHAAETYTPLPCIAGPAGSVPDRLALTGCFTTDDPKKPADLLIPYEVNSPLWSDGADKRRWMSIPAGAKIKILADGDWDLPIGTVLIKEFHVAGKLVETRLFMRHTQGGGWAGYTYEWNDDETEATLLVAGKTKSVTGPDASAPSGWTYPSRAQCMMCHNSASGFSLGLETAQLNRDIEGPDGPVNQLDKLAALGLFDTPLAGADASAGVLPALPVPSDETRTLDERARSYLHSNCGFCHRPRGPGRGAADFRYSRSFDGTHVCDADPDLGTCGVEGAKLLAPGAPEKSVLSLRMRRTQAQRMPPLASAVVDTAGADLVDAWIRSVTACP